MPSHDHQGMPGHGEPGNPLDYQSLRDQLVRAIRRIVPGWLADRGEDIAQTAIMRLLQAKKNGEHGRAPSPSYMWKVAYTATIDEIRRLRRERVVVWGDMERLEAVPTANPGPSESHELSELGAAMKVCMRHMNEQRRLVVGFHLMGHTLPESEKLTGWDGKKVRNLLYRGLADLRSCLARKGFTP